MRPITPLLAGSALALCANLAMAQEAAPAPMQGMDHSAMTGSDTMAPGAMTAYTAAMDDMMTAMADMTFTGDAEADYLQMMIPHHQSAVAMSEAVLPQVEDAGVRALAEAVIATQEAEIAMMRAMLVRLGYPAE